MAGLIVRGAREADLPRIAEMTRDLTVHMGAFEWSVENHLKHVTRRFRNPRYLHMVAEVEGKVIAFTGAEMKSTRTAYMLKGFVEPAHRRKGVMRRLEAALVEELREKGVNKLDLRVYSDNGEGKATWAALGYRTIRETMRKDI
jgi:GNAT superfamily N-acetyltransferase